MRCCEHRSGTQSFASALRPNSSRCVHRSSRFRTRQSKLTDALVHFYKAFAIGAFSAHCPTVGSHQHGRGRVRVYYPAPIVGGRSMSSTLHNRDWSNVGSSVRRFRYVEFLIKSTPALSLAFLTYVTFRDYLW